jgi:chromosome segregation ATPase
MNDAIDLTDAQRICLDVAAHRARWGRMGDGLPSSVRDDELLDALVAIATAGVLDFDVKELQEKNVLANRQKGAAEARATKYINQVKDRDARIEELVEALEEAQNTVDEQAVRINTLQAKLDIYTTHTNRSDGA